MPERHRVVVAEPLGAAGAARLRADPHVDAVFAEGQTGSCLLESVRDAAALIVRSGSRVDAELIAAGAGLRVVGRAGVGVDNIDLDAAAERGNRGGQHPGGQHPGRGRARLRAAAGNGTPGDRRPQLARRRPLGSQAIRRRAVGRCHPWPGRIRPHWARCGPPGAGLRDGGADHRSVHPGRRGGASTAPGWSNCPSCWPRPIS